MTAASDINHHPRPPVDWSAPEAVRRRGKRHAADERLRWIGIGAISLAVGLLAILIGTLVAGGYQAFVQTMVTLEYQVPDDIDLDNRRSARTLQTLIGETVAVELGNEDASARKLAGLLTSDAHFILFRHLEANPSLVGQTITFSVPASDPIDQLNKGTIQRETPEELRRVSDEEIAWFDELKEAGAVSTPFNWGLFTNGDSRRPELAGLKGAIIGSAYALLVCFLISFTVGIGAAVYLEEFAPRNRWTDLIEVNINNLAAVPSIVFGLLGLAVFLNFFGMPRGAPLVGGLVLSLMTLPTMIIVTRAALKAVPPSIREGGLGIGASKHQVITDHVLPLAMPGILTGAIIGLAQALGETAPLLLIGMNASISGNDVGGLTTASTALPTQIFIWADSPERGFVARTSAGILVLLGFLITMNGVAIFLRQRLERKW